jgi:CheY-like chemotaxis protein
VLVVDDDADARELLSTILERAGAQVVTADSAELGFQALPEFRPDVLISDIGMAAEDGYSFMRRVRGLTREAGGRVPALALSAYARAEDRVKALDAGFTTHIGKPLKPNDLLTAVAELAFAPVASNGS